MAERKGKKLMAIVLACAMCFLFGACDKKIEEEPVEGGNTVMIDNNAPKHISSKKIIGFSAPVFLSNRYSGEESHEFEFAVEKVDDKLMAVEKVNDVSMEADEDFLNSLQEIIDKYDLASLNGIYDVTAGLPPECQGNEIKVEYESGEVLSFTKNNEPFAWWAEDVYDLYASYFTANGNDSLNPHWESSPVTRVILELRKDGIKTRYSDVNVSQEKAIKGETHLLCKSMYNLKKDKDIGDKYILFPEDYFEKIADILEAYDIVNKYRLSSYNYETRSYSNHDEGFFGFSGLRPDHSEKDSDDLYVTLHIVYESGTRVNIDTAKLSEIEAMQPLLKQLEAYLEGLF